MDVLQTKKRGGVVRLACKPHELVVAGSNPAPAFNITKLNKFNPVVKNVRRNIILAVYWCKNQRNNVEKTFCFLKPFLKISPNLPRLAPLMIKFIYHRLAAFIVRARRCTLLHGVDIFS